MFSFGRKSVLGLGAVALMGALHTDVQATRFTEEAEFFLANINFPTLNPPPVTAIELKGDVDGGGLFTNTYSSLGPAFSDPKIINTIGVNRIVTASPGVGTVASPVGNGSNEVYVIFALQGIATPTSASSATALFTEGRAIVVSINDSSPLFNEKRPTTWQFDATGANVLGVYNLGIQEDVRKGTNGDTIGVFPNELIAASETNFSAINTVTDVLTQGVFLFDYAGNGLAMDAFPGQEFHKNLNPDGLPGSEGLIIFSQQTNPSQATGFDPNTDEAVLNSIFNTLLGRNFSDNTIPGLSTFDLAQAGDFFNEFGFSANPTSSAIVPEPATAALGLMALAGLALRGRRRQNV